MLIHCFMIVWVVDHLVVGGRLWACRAPEGARVGTLDATLDGVCPAERQALSALHPAETAHGCPTSHPPARGAAACPTPKSTVVQPVRCST
jgi:hypothetical protein